MRFIHTADWQIGKPFKNFGDRESVLKHARLTAIENIGKLAKLEGAKHVLVAGDVYDSEAPSQKSMLEPLERMKQFPDLAWHLIPGNHDPHRPNGLWDRVQQMTVPSNVHLHLTAELSPLGEDTILLPSPLRRKSEATDLTEWMDSAATPIGIIRIGLAHGSVVGFGSDGEANNPITPDRPTRAALNYLALGDWHRTTTVGPSVWYSGTPEPDRFGSQKVGQALLVDIDGPTAKPVITSHPVGSYNWLTLEEEIQETTDLVDLEARLRAISGLSSTIIRLVLKGSMPLTGLADLDNRLIGLQAALFHLDVDKDGLLCKPTSSDLEAIDFGGVLRESAEQLKFMSDDVTKSYEDRRRAENALVQLFLIATGSENKTGLAS